MKQQRLGVTFGLLLLVMAFLFVVSCAKHKDVSTTAGEEATEAAEKAEKAGEEKEAGISEEEIAAREKAKAKAKAEERRRRIEEEKAERGEFLNEHVYFGFDDASLTKKAREILSEKADWLRENRGVEVTIEGHCDERGTKEYNMALGQRRAQSIKNYLVNAGIDESRLETISYGEERPVDSRHNEMAWAKNRRGVFKIK
ncbi:MAG: peptidoglycan-associated lipoprotein Pal [Desulfobacterales bacterium]|nr:peptidoglycan-associated lipoprotein Pal [Desulfobacterales bacterium]